MPRTARKISITGRYHVVLRGNNGNQIFYDPEDYKKFYSIIGKPPAMPGEPQSFS